MKRLTFMPQGMAIWVHEIRGKRDCKNGVAEVRGIDKESGILVVASEYLKLLEEKRNKLTGGLLDEYQVEISDLVMRLKEVRKEGSEGERESDLGTCSSEENRNRKTRISLEESVIKRHKEYKAKKNEIDSSYRVLEKAYCYGIKMSKKGGERK